MKTEIKTETFNGLLAQLWLTDDELAEALDSGLVVNLAKHATIQCSDAEARAETEFFKPKKKASTKAELKRLIAEMHRLINEI